MPTYYGQNPEYQWKVLADKQYEQSKLRQKQEQQIQKQLKQKYLQELSQQIKSKQKSIQFEKKVQKSVDRIEIQKSVQEQKRVIDIQRLKNSMIMERTNKIDQENFIFENQKKRRQMQIKELQNQIQKAKNQEAEMLLNYQKEKQEKKKEYFRLFLKSTMDEQKQRKRILQLRQRQLQRAKLVQLQRIQQKTDESRQRQLERLKERAKKVDYGSHSLFQQNQSKTLVQRKSEEWQIFKDAIQREEILKQMEEKQRMGRKIMQNYYHRQLKDQISQRQQQKRQMSLQQKQRDKSLMDESQRFGWMVQEQKRHIQHEKKKHLHQYLQKQQQHKQYQKWNQNSMKQQELKFNFGTLTDPSSSQILGPNVPRERNYSTIQVQSSRYSKPTPGDTFRMDPQRLRQLETISKSIKNPGSISQNDKIQVDLRTQKYFASKGLSLLG